MGQENGEPVILIHGLFGSLDNLGVIARQLSDSYCIYALDLPNHGRSSHVQGMTLENTAHTIVTWMAEQGLQRAHFLGHSLGGKVAMEIALRYPEKVKQLIVADISPIAYPRRHHNVFDAFRSVDLASMTTRKEADSAMQVHVQESSVRSFLLKNLEKNSDGRWCWRMNLDGLIDDYDQLIGANTSDTLCFTGHVLFLKGELSPYILPSHRETIISLFPHACVKVIGDTHHWLHAEKPSVFVSIVRRFLASPE
jgi:esterase